jgi:hypothetical protein
MGGPPAVSERVSGKADDVDCGAGESGAVGGVAAEATCDVGKTDVGADGRASSPLASPEVRAGLAKAAPDVVTISTASVTVGATADVVGASAWTSPAWTSRVWFVGAGVDSAAVEVCEMGFAVGLRTAVAVGVVATVS